MATRTVHIELTGLARMRQHRRFEVPVDAPDEQIEQLALSSFNDHDWDYQGMEDDTIQVEIVQDITR